MASLVTGLLHTVLSNRGVVESVLLPEERVLHYDPSQGRPREERNAQGVHNQKSHGSGANSPNASPNTVPNATSASSTPATDLDQREIEDLADSFQSSLSSAEEYDTTHYTGSGSGGINDGLREDAYLTKDQESIIENIDSALQKGELPRDTFLYRMGRTPSNQIGDVFTDKGFISTSTSRSVAESFNPKSSRSDLIRISAPKGTKGGQLNRVSLHPHESEFLLPRETSFRITGFQRLGYRESGPGSRWKWQVDLEVVPTTAGVVTRGVYRHLMGKHDQKSHGRGKGGGGAGSSALTPAQESTILDMETRIKDNDYETLVIVDGGGNVLLSKIGEDDSVGVNVYELALLEGNAVTHNHPTSPGSVATFSEADVRSAAIGDATQVRAVTPDHTFIMDRPQGGWPISALTNDMGVIDGARFNLTDKVLSMDRHVPQLELDRMFNTSMHLEWKAYSDANGMNYQRIANAAIGRVAEMTVSREGPLKTTEEMLEYLDGLVERVKKEGIYLASEGRLGQRRNARNNRSYSKVIARIEPGVPEDADYAKVLHNTLALEWAKARQNIKVYGVTELVQEISGLPVADNEAFIIEELVKLGWDSVSLDRSALKQAYRGAFVDGMVVSGKSYRVAAKSAGLLDTAGLELLDSVNLSRPKVLTALEKLDLLDSALDHRLHTLHDVLTTGTRNHMVDTIKASFNRFGPGSEEEMIAAIYKGLTSEETGAFSKSRLSSIVRTEMNYAHSAGTVRQMQELGLKQKQWRAVPAVACPICMRNQDQGTVPIDYAQFESVFGAVSHPPGHPSVCHCHIDVVISEIEALTREDVSSMDESRYLPGVPRDIVLRRTAPLAPTLLPHQDLPHTILRHLMGKHDQKTHGRGSGVLTPVQQHRNAPGVHNQKSHGSGANSPHASPNTVPNASVASSASATDLAQSEVENLAESFHSSLSSDEAFDLDYYTGPGYVGINSRLRHDMSHTTSQESVRENLDSALQKGELPRDTVLYRAGVFEGSTVGDVITDKGFVSTTATRSIAEASTSSSSRSDVLRISASKGTKGGQLNKTSLYPHENEFLLPRGTSFRVTKIDFPGGIRTVHADIVPPAGG